jgi:hypothetical protein
MAKVTQKSNFKPVVQQQIKAHRLRNEDGSAFMTPTGYMDFRFRSFSPSKENVQVTLQTIKWPFLSASSLAITVLSSPESKKENKIG